MNFEFLMRSTSSFFITLRALFRQCLPAATAFASCQRSVPTIVDLAIQWCEDETKGTIRAGHALFSVVWAASEVPDRHHEMNGVLENSPGAMHTCCEGVLWKSRLDTLRRSEPHGLR